MVQFDTTSAQKFCRAYAPKGYLSGAAFWPSEKWVAKAELLSRGLDDTRVAQMLKSVKAKAKFNGCHCTKCGRELTDPDSVAAGMGPECQAA